MPDGKLKWKKNMAKKEVPTSSSSSTCSWSSDDENNSVTLKAIKDYLSNKTELTRQLFKSVKTTKIKMMLPQILKKIDMNDLEELCANELCGMSKSRILSILNGTPMLYSSDTSESDDSGPSLEIISDTEAWISDNEQQNHSSSSKCDKFKLNKKQKLHKNRNGSTSTISKSLNKKIQSSKRNERNSVKIKNERDKEHVKNHEGESLLDLLELEMRARAIKALIRKEEDTASQLESEQDIMSHVNVMNVDDPLTMVNCDTPRETNEKELPHQNIVTNVDKSEQNQIDNENLKSVNIDEDQDVVMLINPTPMINLLSSDSESDNSNKCINKQDKYECINNNTVNQTVELNHEITVEKSQQPTIIMANSNNLENKCDEPCNSSTNIENIDNNGSALNNITSKHDLNSINKVKIENVNTSELNIDHEMIKIENKTDEETLFKGENKLVDEEIIDLDDYPDDMDDIENYEHNLSQNKKLAQKNNVVNYSCEKSENRVMNSAETWTTRYYQTDSVQNVIKESKIQSEIRKRLRERQKLSKLSTCSKNIPKLCNDNNTKLEQINNPLQLTGSVQEYLALEGSTNNVTSVTNSLKQNSIPVNSDNNTS